MAIELTPSDVDEQPQQHAAPSTPSNSRPPAALTADDVDSLPPGLMKRPAESAPTGAKPSLADALKALDEFRARHGHHGAAFTSATGKVHRVNDVVVVNGHQGRIKRKNPRSGLPEIAWDK